MKLIKCNKCGAIARVLQDCNCDNCGIQCCGERMNPIKSNSVDASFEKHIPTYEKVDNKIKVVVNHVMDDEHYIEWIALEDGNIEMVTKLNPGAIAEVELPYIKGSKLYSYCNKHGLWESEVK